MIARSARKDSLLYALAVLSPTHDRTTLRAEKRLMSAKVHEVCSFTQRVLKLPTCNQSRYVGGIITGNCPDLFGHFRYLPNRLREKQQTSPEHDKLEIASLGLEAPQFLLGFIYVNIQYLFIEDKILYLQTVN